jgi:hypothetical protein
MFGRNLLLPSSRWKSKPLEKKWTVIWGKEDKI